MICRDDDNETGVTVESPETNYQRRMPSVPHGNDAGAVLPFCHQRAANLIDRSSDALKRRLRSHAKYRRLARR